MKAYINDKWGVARFSTDDVREACDIGVWFTRNTPDLAEANWLLIAHGTREDLSHKKRREVDVSGASGLADAIRQGPPKPQPIGFVGPFGEDA